MLAYEFVAAESRTTHDLQLRIRGSFDGGTRALGLQHRRVIFVRIFLETEGGFALSGIEECLRGLRWRVSGLRCVLSRIETKRRSRTLDHRVQGG